jgi:hypothetical protein
MEAKRSSMDRVFVAVVLALLTIGLGVVVAVTWRVFPNHALALAAIAVLAPLLLWGFTQDD